MAVLERLDHVSGLSSSCSAELGCTCGGGCSWDDDVELGFDFRLALFNLVPDLRMRRAMLMRVFFAAGPNCCHAA